MSLSPLPLAAAPPAACHAAAAMPLYDILAAAPYCYYYAIFTPYAKYRHGKASDAEFDDSDFRHAAIADYA